MPDLTVIDTVVANSLEPGDLIRFGGSDYKIISVTDLIENLSIEALDLDTEDTDTLVVNAWEIIDLLDYDYSDVEA